MDKNMKKERERKLGFPIVERASSVIVSESRGTPGSASPSAKERGKRSLWVELGNRQEGSGVNSRVQAEDTLLKELQEGEQGPRKGWSPHHWGHASRGWGLPCQGFCGRETAPVQPPTHQSFSVWVPCRVPRGIKICICVLSRSGPSSPLRHCWATRCKLQNETADRRPVSGEDCSGLPGSQTLCPSSHTHDNQQSLMMDAVGGGCCLLFPVTLLSGRPAGCPFLSLPPD